MKLPVLIDCHKQAFAFFGGWPATILYDNMKQVKLSYTQWNPLFLDFASHYGFAPKTHRPYRPRTKGKVERAVHYLDGNFLQGREFADMDDLNAQGLHWCERKANVRVHGTTRCRPCDLWPSEQLTALSAAKPYRLAQAPITRTVDREAMVNYGRSRYSVPPQHSGKTVAVEASAGTIFIRCDDLIIAEHEEAVKPHSSVVLPEHAAALWKMSLQRETSPPPSWQMRFTQEVASRPLESYEVAL
jgi:hypothetical protein